MKNKNYFRLISLCLGVITLSLSVAYLLHAAWTEPTATPPGDNVFAPINVGTTAQHKAGEIGATIFRDSDDLNWFVDPAGTLSAAFQGRVGIGTTGTGSKLTIDGAIEHLGNPRYYRNLASAVVARWQGDPGTVKIRMPKSWSNTMMTMRIQGYDYSGTGAWEVVIGGYNFAGGGGRWINVSADIRGSAPFNQVRLGHDGTRNVVLLGNTGTTWRLGAITVSEFIAAFGNQDNWGEGWSISRITSEAGITNITNVPIHKYITPAGNVGIGTTAPGRKLDVAGWIRSTGHNIINNTSPTTYYQDTNHRSAMVHVNSNLFYVLRGCGVNSLSWCQVGDRWPLVINLENNDATFGRNVTANAYLHDSDKALKTEIAPLENSLARILDLKPVSFRWREDNELSLGLIAQDIEKIFPEIVHTEKESGLKSVNYSALIAPLIQAISEQQTQIEQQQLQIDELKAQIFLVK